jgi:hypothetical protein
MMLAANPLIIESIARQLAEAIRDSGEPLTETMFENMAEMLTHQLYSALAG